MEQWMTSGRHNWSMQSAKHLQMTDFKTCSPAGTSLGKLDFLVAPLLGLVFGR
jgi:hypothetical protein